jgi:multiple sugar transport system substrate-binding protein/raffinose/stachyose/melibiose transport system substrate-binding protein
MRTRKSLAVAAALAVSMAGLAACSTGSSAGDATSTGDASSGSSSAAPVTLTFWHNSTTGDGKAYWEEVAKAYEAANPNVTIEIQAIQNEDMDGKLQTALNAGDAPDIFMARGGGKLADIVAAGQVMDLTDKVTAATKAAVGEGVLSAFTIDGKLYGMPTAILPGGMFYSKDVFAKAGITSTPTNFDELSADVQKLKDSGVQPIALGGKDAWPAAHWYYFMALRDCSQDAMNAAAKTRSFQDPCWLKAGEDLKAFADTKPFNEGFLSTSAQQGAGSSAGMIANHQAGMELMGAWDPGVIASLTPDAKPLPDLGWFPFPAVSDGAGDPTAMMGGVDGYSCWVKAPVECADFLNFYMQKEWQEKYATAFQTLPASKDAQSVVTTPALQDILKAYNDSAYTVVWLDTLFGQNIGNALNAGVVNMLAGSGTPQGIVDAVNNAAAKG